MSGWLKREMGGSIERLVVNTVERGGSIESCMAERERWWWLHREMGGKIERWVAK
jgi:hypothetical protein